MPNYGSNSPSYWAQLNQPQNLPYVASADDWMAAIQAKRDRELAAAARPASTAIVPAEPKITWSSDGLVSYDQYGRRLDSLGHVALRGNSSGGGAPGAPGVPAAPPVTGYPMSAITGQPLPLAPSLPMTIPFVDPSFAAPGIAGPGQAPVAWPELNDAMMQRALAYYNAALPWVQTNIGAYQNQRDFNETGRRFDLEFPQRQAEAGYAAAGRAQLPNARYVSYR